MKILKEELEQVDDLSVVLQYKDVQNISIKIDKDGRILVGLPYYGAKARALTFVREKADWLRKHLVSRAEQELPIPDNGFDGTNIWLWWNIQLDFRYTCKDGCRGNFRFSRLYRGRIKCSFQGQHKACIW